MSEHMLTDTRRIPDHVPPALIREFDLYNFIAAKENVYDACYRIAVEEPDIFFTPNHGGFWVVNRADLMEEVYQNWTLFSSNKCDGGAGVPPSPPESPASLPVEVDGERHKALRHPLNLALAPKAVQKLAVTARALAVSLIEDMKPRGRCEC